MSATEIRQRAKLLNGESVDLIDDNNESSATVERAESPFSEQSQQICSDNDHHNDDNDDDQMSIIRKNRRERLIYNDSDDESDSDIFDRIKSIGRKNSPQKQFKPPDNANAEEEMNTITNAEPVQMEFDSEDFNSQTIRRRLADLEDSENIDDLDEISNKSKKRARLDLGEESPVNSDDDGMDDADNPILSYRKKKARILDDDDD